MKLLDKTKLENLTTKRLLAYRDRLLRCYDEPHWDESLYRIRVLEEVYKCSVEWAEHYKLVKAILATREHVSRLVKKNHRRK